MAPPDILLLTTDQPRADTLGAYGNAVIRTPTLDRLARARRQLPPLHDLDSTGGGRGGGDEADASLSQF